MAARKRSSSKTTSASVDTTGQSEEKKIGIEHGYTGTAIYNGHLDVDYQEDWKDLTTRIPLIKQMKWSDSTISGILEAVKAPLKSAKYYIEPASQDADDLEIANFIKRAVFEELQQGYKFESFLESALSYLDYGFAVHEKIFKMKDGQVFWDRFAPRIQSSIHNWTITGKPWENGHPAGITQIVNGTDEVMVDGKAPKTNIVEIPWSKLVILTNKQEGNNFEGESMLRPAYLNWYCKQTLYKVSAISAERFGVGIPYIKHKKGIGGPKIDKLSELVKNIRSNEQAYAVFDTDVEEFGIMTPNGAGVGQNIIELLRLHDRKAYDSVLAGFLNLTSGEGGSNSLSQDHSAFFLRSLQCIAAKFCSTFDSHIQELVYINYPNAKRYPCMKVSDISHQSLLDYVNAMAIAREKELTPWIAKDEDKVREQLKLSALTDQDREEIEEEKEEAMQAQRDLMTSASSADPKEAKKEEDMVKDPVVKVDDEESSYTELAEDSPLRPTKREATFVKNISDYENLLESTFADIQAMVAPYEQKYREVARKIYEQADKERIDGVERFARTAKNKDLEKKVLAAVKVITDNIEAKLIDSPIQKRLFASTREKALKAVKEDETLLSEIAVDERKFDSFVRGYNSNVEGILFNEPRRIAENIIMNFGSQVSVGLAVKQTDGIEFNKNILKLSTITHARAAYNAIQFDANVSRGFTHYKVLVPKKTIKTLDPSGKTAELLFGIYTAGQLNKRINDEMDGKNTDVISGLGLHHGAFTYYFPVPSDQLDEELALSKQQRASLREQLASNTASNEE